jgi:hypothetical protein
MPGPGFGPCEVCGVETNKRCSACVQVGIELFFCSSEHQKLVSRERRTLWARAATGLTDTASLRPAGLESSQDHKPFAVPPLSKDEMASVNQRYTKPFITQFGMTTLQSDLTSLSGLPPIVCPQCSIDAVRVPPSLTLFFTHAGPSRSPRRPGRGRPDYALERRRLSRL